MDQYRKALTEVGTIINNMPDELIDKIPNQLKAMLKEEKDKQYQPKVNDLVIKNNMLPETTVILGLIYRDFLCSKSEKEKLQAEDNEMFRKLKIEEKEQKFNYEELFPKKIRNQKEEIQLIETKKTWYQKVIDYFRRKIKERK